MNDNEILLYYWDAMPNMGDALNKVLCEKLFHITPIVAQPFDCEAAFCGSLLDDFLYPKAFPIHYKFGKESEVSIVHIWGAGFIAGKWKCASIARKFLPETYFRKVEVHAIRGELSRKRLEKITHTYLGNVPLADPGLLASDLVKEKEKKYDLGIVAHHLEKGMSVYRKFDHYKNVCFIDVEEEPLDCISQISECKCILSSSLHGLIFADSFGIPNARIKASNLLKGGDYKFNDYYSSYGLYPHKFYDIRKKFHINLEEVVENYKITKEMVAKKKDILYDSFPKCLLNARS